MKRISQLLFAIATVLVLAATAASFITGARGAIARGERAASAEFSILRNSLLNLQRREDLYDVLLRKRLVALYNGSERLLAAQILDSSGLVVWKVPADSPYFALPNDPKATGGFSAPEGRTAQYSSPLGGEMKLSALYSTLRRSDVAGAVAFPVGLSLAWMLVLLVLLANPFKRPKPEARSEETLPAPEGSGPAEPSTEILEAGTHSGPETQSAEIEEAAEPPMESEYVAPEVKSEEPSLADEEIDALLDQEEAEEADAAEAGTEAEESEDEAAEEMEEGNQDLEKEAQIPSAPKPSFDESLSRLEREIAQWTAKRKDFAAPEEPPVETEGEKPERPEPSSETPRAEAPRERLDVSSFPMPLSLQSPALESKLTEELGRPLSDLALMLIHCSLANPGDPAAVAMAVTIKDYIGSKDLVFELYKGGFAVVLPSVDLGGALKMSEDLADVLATTLGLYTDLEDGEPIFIGISAAAGRKVDSYKVFREASTAIHKAVSGGKSKILAFRPKA
ncbi:MAG: hypothetical protein AB1407_07420 [Spirochaetota bacterium]